MRFREHVRVLFDTRPRQRTIKKIVEATGLPFAWLSDYSRKRVENQDVDKLQTLYEHLTGDTTRLNF